MTLKPSIDMDLTKIGHWAFIGGLALSVLAGFIQISSLPLILFILGVVVGFLNIKDKESMPFLVSVIALLVIGVAGLQLGTFTGVVTSVLNNFIAFVAAAGIVVVIKQILSVALRQPIVQK